MEGLEIRKPHVAKLERVSEDLVKMISEDGPVQDNIRSRIADIHDAWNKVVKKNIENCSKVRPEAYSEPCQASKMELVFGNNRFQPLTIFAKLFLPHLRCLTGFWMRLRRSLFSWQIL